jgi:hypothetical protein
MAKYHLHADTRHKILVAVLEVTMESSRSYPALVEVMTGSSVATHVNLFSLMLTLTENTIKQSGERKTGLV